MDEDELYSYSQLLKQYIKKSGLTLEEISKRCAGLGVNIHPTYISKLRLGTRPAPSKEITAALSKVIGGDELKLLTASLLERLPEEDRKRMSAANFYIDSVSDSITNALNQQIKFSFKDDQRIFGYTLRIIYAFAIKSSIIINFEDLKDPQSIEKLITSKLEASEKAELLSLIINIDSESILGKMPDIPDSEFEEWFNDERNYAELVSKQEDYVAGVEKMLINTSRDKGAQETDDFLDQFILRTSKLPEDEKQLVANMIELILKKYSL